MDPTSDKVKAAAAASAAAGMVGTIAFWALAQYAHTDVPAAVQAAAVGLLALVLTWAAAYLVPEGHPSPSARAALRRSPPA